MFFTILTIVCVLGILYQLTYGRYLAARARTATKADYFSWVLAGLSNFFKKDSFEEAWIVLRDWVKRNYPGWTQWVFWVLAACFVYLALSGFFFAVFIRRGMFGVPLLLHVSVGGLFAVCLALTLLLRARAYRLDREGEVLFAGFARIALKPIPKSLVLGFLFWIFALAGLVLMLTALGSMVPTFSFDAQTGMIGIHRYSALIALLAGLAFTDIAIFPQPQAQ